MVCTSLGSLLRPLFYFLCYIHLSLSVHVCQTGPPMPISVRFISPKIMEKQGGLGRVYSGQSIMLSSLTLKVHFE